MTLTPPRVVCNGNVAVTVCVVRPNPNTVTISSCEKLYKYDAAFTTAIAETLAEVLALKLPSPEYTAWTSTPEELATKAVGQGALPVPVPESHVRVSVAQPDTSVQVAPLVVEYWNSTVPVGAVLSVPGGVIATVAV